jgi:lysine-N-methylase
MLTRLFKQGMNFKCIGNKCIDSCCTDWDITFDQKTYEDLSQNPDFKNTMADYGYINDHVSIPTINYGIINLTEDNRCPFLDGDDLCILQKSMGERRLSNVCALYPRYYNLVDGLYEESLSLACIEATEQLLLGDPLELVQVERGPKRDIVLQTINTQNDNNITSAFSCLHDFRKVIFEFIRSEDCTFDEKLGMLLSFHEHIEKMDQEELILTLKSYDFSHKATGINIDLATYSKLIDFLKNVGKSGHTELDDLTDQCINKSHYKSLELEKRSSIDKIMSNYLIHQMYKDLYPFISLESKMDSFQYLLKKVQILRLLIAYDGSFNPKRVARIIQMYSKGLEHHGGFYYELEGLRV